VSPSFELKFSGSSRAQYGAMLVKTSDTYTEDSKRDLLFRRYMRQHWRSWLAFARSDAMGRDVKKEGLMLIVGLELTKDFSGTAFYSHDSRFKFAFEAGVSNLASLSLGGWKHRQISSSPTHGAGSFRDALSEAGPSHASESDSDSSGSEVDMSRVHVEYSAGPSAPASSLPSLGGLIIEDYSRHAHLLPPPDHRQSVFLRRLCYRRRPNRLTRLVAPLQLVAGAGPHDLGSGDRSFPGAPPVSSRSQNDLDTSGSEPSNSDSSDSEFDLISDMPAQVCYISIRYSEHR
jgi:hypothetical protein